MSASDQRDSAELMRFQRETLEFHCSPIVPGCTISRRLLEMLKIVYDQKKELSDPHHYAGSQGVQGPLTGDPRSA